MPQAVNSSREEAEGESYWLLLSLSFPPAIRVFVKILSQEEMALCSKVRQQQLSLQVTTKE